MANSKSPGADGLPVEMCKKYGKHLLPALLETLNAAVKKGCAYPPP